MKAIVITSLVTLLIIVSGVFLFSRNNSEPVPSYPLPEVDEYFWGEGCPHCKNVDDFIVSWEKKDSYKFTSLEAWNNKENENRLVSRVVSCNLPKKNIAVPMLFTTEGKCIMGDTPIIDYLKGLSL